MGAKNDFQRKLLISNQFVDYGTKPILYLNTVHYEFSLSKLCCLNFYTSINFELVLEVVELLPE